MLTEDFLHHEDINIRRGYYHLILLRSSASKWTKTYLRSIVSPRLKMIPRLLITVVQRGPRLAESCSQDEDSSQAKKRARTEDIYEPDLGSVHVAKGLPQSPHPKKLRFEQPTRPSHHRPADGQKVGISSRSRDMGTRTIHIEHDAQVLSLEIRITYPECGI